MTGAEHYARAEQLLALADLAAPTVIERIVAVAQVHATLALAYHTGLAREIAANTYSFETRGERRY